MSSTNPENILKQINRCAGNCKEIKEFMESLIIPYKYFKKLHILPINMVEEEIDKYFDIKHILLENYFYLPNIIYKNVKIYELIISNWTLDNYSKYYNNFPLKYMIDNYSDRPIKEDIIKNLDKYNTVLDEQDYLSWTNKIYNTVNTIFNTNKKDTQYLIEQYDTLNKKIEQGILKKKAVDKLVVGDIVKFAQPCRLGASRLYVDKYKVIKLNPKTIKFVELLYNDNREGQNRLVKYDMLRLAFQDIDSDYEVN